MGPPGQPWSRPLVTFLGVPPFLALIETVTIAVHLQNMNVVGEAVEQCPRQAFGAEHFGPLVEGKIASQQCGPEIELVGEITNMIEAAQTAGLKGKAASEEAASLKNYRSSVKVVAGAGFVQAPTLSKRI